jgi:pimeloyl-ACP methyl ester carboxylesterase
MASDKKPKDASKKPGLLKAAALYTAAGVALLGAGYGAHEVVKHFTPEDPGVTMSLPSPACAQQITDTFNGRSLRDAPQGDGHPVMVLPGVLGNDMSMTVLSQRIEAQGYKVYGWDAGMNLGPSEETARHLEQHLARIYAENGNRKVSLVGYSLGGVYARELARKHPDMVRDVITLSSPYAMKGSNGWPDDRVRLINQYFQPQQDKRGEELAAEIASLPQVRSTSVYSDNDWIVDTKSAISPQTTGSENLPVNSGHVALPFDNAAAGLVLDRLAQPEGALQPLAARVCRVENKGPA